MTSWLSRLIRLPLRLVPPNRPMRIWFGELRGWRWISGSATHGSWLGTYERETQAAFKHLIRPGDVVYDVGANAGFFTLLAAKLVGPTGLVVAFEPVPRNLQFLEQHLRLNDVRNVTVVPAAVSAASGSARFATSKNAAMGALADAGDLEVPIVVLDELISAGTLPPPAFVKIDVEGAESQVFAGAAQLLRDHHPAILLSEHGYVQHQQCSSLLESAGYELEPLRDGAADGNYVVLAKPRSPAV